MPLLDTPSRPAATRPGASAHSHGMPFVPEQSRAERRRSFLASDFPPVSYTHLDVYKRQMKYPAVYLLGRHAKGETLSIAFAGEGQHQDAGAKMVHAAPDTSSSIVSKSVARGGGRTSYRGLIQINEGAHGAKSTVRCDALLVDTISRSDTYPYVDVREDDVQMGHEATVSKVSDDQLFYLQSRGMAEDEAMAMIVRGFVEPIARELPMEYALELNRLIELQMEGAVG